MIPEKEIKEESFEAMFKLYDESLIAPDKVELHKKWKSLMKSEKLYLSFQTLFMQNLEKLTTFD
jgi:hypothetical protein